MKPIRIGNMEYRETAYTVPHNGRETYEEIIAWQPNSYYGAEDRMKAEGWTFDEDGDAHKGTFHVSSGCFKGKECCHTVATIGWNGAHDEFDVRSCGLRAFRLDKENHKDFLRILDLIRETVSDND